jgi:galactose mutarotase-like enzyme
MATRITEERWARARAVVLENDFLRAVVLPEQGARIASLVHRPSGREVLWSPPGLRALPPPTYGMPYADHPAVGIDECLPTIWADRFEGRDLPDHGEAWTVPWEATHGRDHIETTVTLRQSPFRLTRRVRFVNDAALRLDYALMNTGNAPAPCLWALHPLMNWQQGMRIILPPAVSDVEIGSVSGVSPLHEYAPATWPQTAGLDLAGVQLNTDNAPAATKVYVGPMTERWAALHDTLAGFVIGFAFTTPMLGLWLNRGAWGGFTHIAIEPATGISEHLSTAVERGNILTVPAGETAYWSVTIVVTNGIFNVTGVTMEGAVRM